MTEAIDLRERTWRTAETAGDKHGMANADTQRIKLTKERDALMVFSECLAKFVRSYEYVTQLVYFADPGLEAFSAYARLLHKRLKGV